MRTLSYTIVGLALVALIPACSPAGLVAGFSAELSLDGEWIVVVDQVPEVDCLTIEDGSVIVYDLGCDGTDDALSFGSITFDEVGPTFILAFEDTTIEFLLTETADGYNLTAQDLIGDVLFTGTMRGF